MTVGITRTDLDAADLRAAATRSKDAAAARRMLARALVTEGHNRSEATRAAGMDRQTLRDWVHRYNESGLAGLQCARADLVVLLCVHIAISSTHVSRGTLQSHFADRAG